MPKITNYILVLDADPDANSHISKQLRNKGYTVYSATTADDALFQIKQARKSGVPCQLVLLSNEFGSAQRNQTLNVLKRLRGWKGFNNVTILGAVLPAIKRGRNPKNPEPNPDVWARVLGKDPNLLISPQTFHRKTSKNIWDIRSVLPHLTNNM